jgi:hypothetical protein
LCLKRKTLVWISSFKLRRPNSIQVSSILDSLQSKKIPKSALVFSATHSFPSRTFVSLSDHTKSHSLSILLPMLLGRIEQFQSLCRWIQLSSISMYDSTTMWNSFWRSRDRFSLDQLRSNYSPRNFILIPSIFIVLLMRCCFHFSGTSLINWQKFKLLTRLIRYCFRSLLHVSLVERNCYYYLLHVWLCKEKNWFWVDWLIEIDSG